MVMVMVMILDSFLHIKCGGQGRSSHPPPLLFDGKCTKIEEVLIWARTL